MSLVNVLANRSKRSTSCVRIRFHINLNTHEGPKKCPPKIAQFWNGLNHTKNLLDLKNLLLKKQYFFYLKWFDFKFREFLGLFFGPLKCVFWFLWNRILTPITIIKVMEEKILKSRYVDLLGRFRAQCAMMTAWDSYQTC